MEKNNAFKCFRYYSKHIRFSPQYHIDLFTNKNLHSHTHIHTLTHAGQNTHITVEFWAPSNFTYEGVPVKSLYSSIAPRLTAPSVGNIGLSSCFRFQEVECTYL